VSPTGLTDPEGGVVVVRWDGGEKKEGDGIVMS